MQEILQGSRFVLQTVFFDLTGQRAQIQSFKFSYYTGISTPVVVEFDGTTYSTNCQLIEGGVVSSFLSPRFDVGQLMVRREFSIASPYYPDGQRMVEQVEALPFWIVRSLGDSPPPSELKAKSVEVGEQSLLAIETLRVEAFKGEKGDDGAVGVDLSQLNVEKNIPGAFFPGGSGDKKQIYAMSKLLTLTTPSSTMDGNYLFSIGIQGLPIRMEGVIQHGQWNDWVGITNNSQIGVLFKGAYALSIVIPQAYFNTYYNNKQAYITFYYTKI